MERQKNVNLILIWQPEGYVLTALGDLRNRQGIYKGPRKETIIQAQRMAM